MWAVHISGSASLFISDRKADEPFSSFGLHYRPAPGLEAAPGPKSQMVRPLGQKQADPSLFTALINEPPTHKSLHCKRYR